MEKKMIWLSRDFDGDKIQLWLNKPGISCDGIWYCIGGELCVLSWDIGSYVASVTLSVVGVKNGQMRPGQLLEVCMETTSTISHSVAATARGLADRIRSAAVPMSARYDLLAFLDGLARN